MKKLLSLFIFCAICAPYVVGAQDPAVSATNPTTSGTNPATSGTNPTTSGTNPTVVGNPQNPLAPQSQRMIGLPNPLGDKVTSIPDLFYLLVNSLFKLSYIVIAGFILWSGFKFVTAQGEPDAISDAKNTFKYTIIGALIIIGAQTIIEIVKSIITGLGIA